MYLALDGHGDLYAQLARALKQAMLDGRLAAGERLPSSRQLSKELGLSRNTVVTAFELLLGEHIVESRTGAGTFVAAAVPARTSRAPSSTVVAAPSRYAERARRLPPLHLRPTLAHLRYDLQYGEPLVDPPLATAWRRALGHALARCDLRYGPSAGVWELREAISRHVARRRGISCAADDVLIVGGAQQAINLAARVLLNEGDTAVLEDPSYQLAEMALQAHGARLQSVAVDGDGLRVAALPAAGARLVLVTPSHQFPSGAVMSLERRMALLDYADRHGAWIVEDDYDGEFRFGGPLLPALRSLDSRGRVLYVGSFSKLLFPALRLGYIVCPPSLREDLTLAKRLADISCPAVEQLALADLMQSGAFERHLRFATAELRRRRAALLDGLSTHCARRILVHDSGAGMHLVGWLPGWTQAGVQALVQHAHAQGLGLQSIGPHFHRPLPPTGLLLGYAGLSPKQLGAAAALLGRCLAEGGPAAAHAGSAGADAEARSTRRAAGSLLGSG
jgi:GntR family transcriptional regulator / MocR family aminotransferase